MRTLIVAAIAALAAVVGTTPDPKIEQWYSAQHNGHGDWCCDKADGHDFYDDYAFDPDGDVSFKAGGMQYRLPAYMALKGANPTGGRRGNRADRQEL